MSSREVVARRVTRGEILSGRAMVVYVQIEALGAEVPIRRLTSRQKAEIEAMMARGFSLNVSGIDPSMGGQAVAEAIQRGEKVSGMDVGIDMVELMRASSEAQLLAVHYGLAFDEPVSLADVDEIDPLAVEEIAAQVYRISGIKQEDYGRIAAFRDQ